MRGVAGVDGGLGVARVPAERDCAGTCFNVDLLCADDRTLWMSGRRRRPYLKKYLGREQGGGCYSYIVYKFWTRSAGSSQRISWYRCGSSRPFPTWTRSRRLL